MILTDGICTGCPVTFVKGGPAIWETPMSDPYGEYRAAVNRAMKEVRKEERKSQRRPTPFQQAAYFAMLRGNFHRRQRRRA